MKREPRFALRRAAAAAIALAVLALGWATFEPFAGDGGTRLRIVIPPDAGAGEIGDILDRSGIVPSASLFELRATLAGDRDRLKPGIIMNEPLRFLRSP